MTHIREEERSISMTLCLYVVPFIRYSASKNGVTLKLGVRVIKGH